MTLLKPKEVAAMLRINESSVYRLCRDGKIGSYLINKETVRISEDDLNTYLQSRRMKPLSKQSKTSIS